MKYTITAQKHKNTQKEIMYKEAGTIFKKQWSGFQKNLLQSKPVTGMDNMLHCLKLKTDDAKIIHILEIEMN